MGILHGAFYASVTHIFIRHMFIRSYVNTFIRSYVNTFIRHTLICSYNSYTYMLTVTNTNRIDINLDVDINVFALTVDYLIYH